MGVGNRSSMNTARPGLTVNNDLSYFYDSLNRLVQATNPLPTLPNETFTYDPVGNRLTEEGQIVSSIFDDANRLLEDEQFTYIYDDNGNLIKKTDKTTTDVIQYTYDAENRLIQIDKPDMTAIHSYDGLGRRIEKDVNGVITRYIYDSEDVLLEYDGTNTLTASYTHGDGIDEPLIMNRGGQSFFYHTDALGSIADLTDSAGNVSQSYVYDSFGRIANEIGSIINPYTFTGREFDPEFGLYYYRARYYESSVGRFLQQDGLNLASIQLPKNIVPESFSEFSLPLLLSIPSLQQNLYSYVLNNPVNLIDPFGLFVTQPPCSCGQSPNFEFTKTIRCVTQKKSPIPASGEEVPRVGFLTPICLTAITIGSPVISAALAPTCIAVIFDIVDCLNQGFVCPSNR